jgi:hypothetical protein
MNCSRDLVPAIRYTRVWESDHAARSKRLRDVPLASSFEQALRSRLAEGLVLFPVEFVNVILQFVAIQFHRDPFSLNLYGLPSPALQFLDRRDF